MKKVSTILKSKDFKAFMNRKKYVTREFQDYGYRLAAKLGDLSHKSLYIKLAKEEKRALLEEALNFAVDYPGAKNKGKIFMWKLGELRKQKHETRNSKLETNSNSKNSNTKTTHR